MFQATWGLGGVIAYTVYIHVVCSQPRLQQSSLVHGECQKGLRFVTFDFELAFSHVLKLHFQILHNPLTQVSGPKSQFLEVVAIQCEALC